MAIKKILYQGILWRGIYFLSAFILNIVIARQMQASDSGNLFYIVSIFTLVLMILGLGTEAAIGYFTANGSIATQKLISFCIVASLAMSAIVFATAGIYGNLAGTGNIATLAVLFITGNYILGCASMFFYSRNNFLTPNLINTIMNIFLMLFFWFASKENSYVTMIFFTSFFVLAIVTLAAFVLEHEKAFSFYLPSKSDLSKLFNYSLRAFAGNILFFLLYRIDYWFVEKYCNEQDLGNYIQVSKLAQMFFVLPGILASAIFPYTASGNTQEVNRTLTPICRLLFMTYGAICLMLAITGKWLFPWIYGESFNNMYSPFLLLIPGILAFSTLFTLTAYYAGKNRLSVNLIGAFISLSVILIGDIILIPRYGINAAAFVSTLGYVAYYIYVVSVFKKEYKTPLGDFFKLKLSDVSELRSMVSNKTVRANK